MNRVIDFRGKSIKTGAWYKGSFHKNSLGECFIVPPGALAFNPEGASVCIAIPIIPESAGQLTGLVDKNGKEIYEGDIMGWPVDDEENGFVVYEENACQFRIASKSEYSTSCHIGINIGDKGQAVVIGNIIDNPELIA